MVVERLSFERFQNHEGSSLVLFTAQYRHQTGMLQPYGKGAGRVVLGGPGNTNRNGLALHRVKCVVDRRQCRVYELPGDFVPPDLGYGFTHERPGTDGAVYAAQNRRLGTVSSVAALAHSYCPRFAVVHPAILYLDLLEDLSRIHVFDLTGPIPLGVRLTNDHGSRIA